MLLACFALAVYSIERSHLSKDIHTLLQRNSQVLRFLGLTISTIFGKRGDGYALGNVDHLADDDDDLELC